MRNINFSFIGKSGKSVFVNKWLPDSSPARAVLQVSHGMGEHSARYERLAKFLTSHGIAVYANDHEAHGKTAGKPEEIGIFNEKDGFTRLIDDLRNLSDIISSENPSVPFFIFGHSMGALAALGAVCSGKNYYSGLILSGLPSNPGSAVIAGMFIAKIQELIFGRNRKSGLLNEMTFGSFNNNFKPVRTKFDWLSRDNSEVDKYVNDPYCGGILSIGFFEDFFKGIREVYSDKSISGFPSQLPVFLFSGSKDPVSGSGKSIKSFADILRKKGVISVDYTIYENGRHESLNEINRDNVTSDIIEWINKKAS